MAIVGSSDKSCFKDEYRVMLCFHVHFMVKLKSHPDKSVFNAQCSHKGGWWNGGSARMFIPKMSTPIMSIPKMSIPIMSTVPQCIFP